MLVVPIFPRLLSIVAMRIEGRTVGLPMDLRLAPRIRVDPVCQFFLVLRMPLALFIPNQLV